MRQWHTLAAAVAGLVACEAPAGVDLTFFGWSDQHVQTDGSVSANAVAGVTAINTLAGRAYPPAIGGTVAEPAFVFGAGDISEWPTFAALNAYKNPISGINYPTYDIAGNHDDGGLVPSATITNWLIEKHGGLSYRFTEGGVHFVAVHSAFDASKPPNQPISDDALAYIRESVSLVPKGAPIVVATHLNFTAITNPDALVDAFGESNVILVMGGHYHQAAVDTFRGVNFLQLPSPASTTPAITSIHITSDRLTAVSWNYATESWMGGSTVLDAAITVPEPATAGAAALAGVVMLGRRVRGQSGE